ncbi:helix-turn-helix transcriptional regulator [Bradyrhizobium tropiciagri]|uniref:helix-turn-helix transcriptional regulator n=1 Tax=Bradyrhizobium tropiciagri TaxID=312253 RepID=UPI00067E1617|nr:AraC family transcriptional regulator [Bradyrhizobium tropiciagri]
MQTHAHDADAVRLSAFDEPGSPVFSQRRSRERARLLWIDGRFVNDDRQSGCHQLPDRGTGETNSRALEITPAHAVSRCAMGWDGIAVEIVQCVTHDTVEFRSHGRCHLLLVHEEGVRHDGETLVGDLPPSKVRTLRRKLTFVPAGHEYRDWQRPSIPSRITCFYFDPGKMPTHPDANRIAALVPLLHFENNVLWEIATKLTAALGHGGEDERYCEALGVIVGYEVSRLQGHILRREPLARGGLAVWQQRIVIGYIEEHLCEPISLATLATLVRLSSFYFCRAFKQSFGIPPHRYHANRRIERAKALLANPKQSVTEIGLALGFSETSSFSAAFRQTTGITPTEYRRTL